MNVLICDQCEKKEELPAALSWFEVSSVRQGFRITQHFCSWDCLADYGAKKLQPVPDGGMS